jgi:hypothetical protein
MLTKRLYMYPERAQALLVGPQRMAQQQRRMRGTCCAVLEEGAQWFEMLL